MQNTNNATYFYVATFNLKLKIISQSKMKPFKLKWDETILYQIASRRQKYWDFNL